MYQLYHKLTDTKRTAATGCGQYFFRALLKHLLAVGYGTFVGSVLDCQIRKPYFIFFFADSIFAISSFLSLPSGAIVTASEAAVRKYFTLSGISSFVGV